VVALCLTTVSRSLPGHQHYRYDIVQAGGVQVIIAIHSAEARSAMISSFVPATVHFAINNSPCSDDGQCIEDADRINCARCT
jgi:hypothetical protein